MRRIYRVDCHDGNLFSLVEFDTPKRAVEIARAWRERKYLAEGEYVARPASEQDLAWAAKFGCRPYSAMPPPAPDKRRQGPRRPQRVSDTDESDESNTAPSHERLVATLNIGWRIVEERLQWIVQRRRSRDWNSRRFCTTRAVLLRDVRELCGTVSPEALVVLEALPDRHPGLVAYEKSNFAKAKGGPGQAKPRLRIVADIENAEAA